MQDSPNTLWAPAKTVAWGVLWLAGAGWFLWHIAGNPLNELALIRRAEVTPASLVETYVDEVTDFRDHIYLVDVGIYAYRLPDGREYKMTDGAPLGQLKEQQQVEYLPEKPTVSRIKGDGCQTVVEWLWRKVGLGSLLLLIFSSPGIHLLWTGLRDIGVNLIIVRPNSKGGPRRGNHHEEAHA